MFGKKKRHHATADLSEQAMSDSLRAAQAIFQKHTDSQVSLSSGSTGTASQASAHPRTRKPGHGAAIPRIVQQRQYRSVSSVPRSGLSLTPSSGSSQQQLSRPVSPLRSDSAHAAAAVAHMALSRESERQQEELLKLSVLSKAPRPTATSHKVIQESARGPSSEESGGNHAGAKEKNVNGRPNSNFVASEASSVPRQTIPHPPSASQSRLEVRQLPTKQPSAHPAASPGGSKSVSMEDQERLGNNESRSLLGRIPPPDIYFESKNDDAEIGQEMEGGEEDEASLNQQRSSSSNVSSSSAMSFVTGGPSYPYDDGDLDSEEQDFKSDVGEYTGSEIESFDRLSSDVPGRAVSVSSLPVEPDEIKTQTTPVKTNATYGTLNRIGHGNVMYQGTLPDLIPNHMRRTRIEKFRTKLFGAKSKPDAVNDQGLSRSSVTADEEGRPVVTTNHNLRFKTTMRGHGHHSSSDYDNVGEPVGGQLDGTITNNYREGTLIDSEDDDSDSVEDHGDDKKRKRRTARLKRRLKHTTVPYTHHLHHHETRHHTSHKGFNEDKPWKSHKDVGFVTPSERKRYEGMWVSNRCLYLELLPWWASVISGQSAPPAKLPEDGLILNLVAKDIWARSNLPGDLLRQIYEKVDTRGDGTLDRKSFIVGMWLVDQCLYGRKLPKEVGQQVWDSVDRYVVNVINSAAMKHMGKSKKKLMKQEIKNIKKDIKNVHL